MDVILVEQEGDRPVDYVHRYELNPCKEDVFDYFWVPDLLLWAALVDKVDQKRYEKEGCQKDSEKTEAEAGISDVVGVKGN